MRGLISFNDPDDNGGKVITYQLARGEGKH